MQTVDKALVMAIFCISLQFFNRSLAQPPSFSGQVNADNINVRSDATITAEVIYSLNKGEGIEVVSSAYDWYRIRLPKSAPSFIKKELALCISYKTPESTQLPAPQGIGSCRSAKVIKASVNIRSKPQESSAIIGKANDGEVVTVLQDTGSWYKIRPIDNSFGWIHKKFVNKSLKHAALKKDEPANVKEKETTTFEGIVQPYGKIFRRTATHKLLTKKNEVFLLKGSREALDTLNYRNVKITGNLTVPHKGKYPIIEIIKIEAQD